MIDATPSSTAARNGSSSTSRSRSGACSTTGSAWWESTEVSPCPGKCFAQAATPSACRPRITARPSRATSSARSPNARSPMAGLSGLVPTSITGAKSHVTPTAASSAPERPAEPLGEALVARAAQHAHRAATR